MEGTKLIKGTYTDEEYAKAAKWCNENGGRIEEIENGYIISGPTPVTEIEARQIKFSALRVERNRRLAETDFYLVADYPIEAEKLERIKAYRQALRDLPSLSGAPWDGGGDKTPWPVMEKI